MSLLSNDVWRTELAGLIESASLKFEMELNAFVFMPNHVHLLIYPVTKTPEIPKFPSFKQPFSKFVKQILVSNNSKLIEKLMVQERPGKICFRFWQEGGGYDRNLFQADSVEASINYIHMNPVKAGLVKKAAEWKWSSAAFYELGQNPKCLPGIAVNKPAPELFDAGGLQTDP